MITRCNEKLDICLTKLNEKYDVVDEDIVDYLDQVRNLLASDDKLEQAFASLDAKLEEVKSQKKIYSDWLLLNKTTGWTHDKARQNINYLNKETCLQKLIDTFEEIHEVMRQDLSGSSRLRYNTSNMF